MNDDFILDIVTETVPPKFTLVAPSEKLDTPLTAVAVTVAVFVLPRASVAVTVYV